MHWRRKWQPTPVFLPGESQGRGSLVGCRLWVAQSQTRLKRLSGSSSSSMISTVEHLLMCLLAICLSSMEKMSIQVFCPYFVVFL